MREVRCGGGEVWGRCVWGEVRCGVWGCGEVWG